MRIAALCVAVLCAAGAGAADSWKAETWRSADRLFHSDPRWLGGDAAYTIPLGPDRVLWLFGDTFIGDGKQKRADSSFIRTSIAVQHGLNPADAEITFHWRTANGTPHSYFPASDASWLWPLHGVYRNGSLTIFLSRLLPADTGLRFTGIGSTALRCENPDASPDEWIFRSLAVPRAPNGLDKPLYGVAVLDTESHVLAYCVDEESDNAYLVRWRSKPFDRGELVKPEWWNGADFVAPHELDGPPAIVFPDAATEFSVHRLSDGRYMQVQTLGFGATEVGVRYATQPQGPWTEPQPVYRPRESRARDVFVYAAKAHPVLEGAPILVTYAANHFKPEKLLRSRSLYYPRFVRLTPPTSPSD